MNGPTNDQVEDDDPILAELKRQGQQPTRENYIALAGNPDEEWTPEHEDQIPTHLQDYSQWTGQDSDD